MPRSVRRSDSGGQDQKQDQTQDEEGGAKSQQTRSQSRKESSRRQGREEGRRDQSRQTAGSAQSCQAPDAGEIGQANRGAAQTRDASGGRDSPIARTAPPEL